MKKKFWWELTPKERKEMLERSKRIFDAFDFGVVGGNEANKGDYIIKEIVYQTVEKEWDDLLEKIPTEKIFHGSPDDYLWKFFNPICHSAFAIGYIMGQMFDLAHPSLLTDVKALTRKLKERRCFAYLPRERKAEAPLTK